MATMTKPTISGKPVEFVASAAFAAHYADIERVLYIKEALRALHKHPVDMLVFEQPKEGVMQIRSAGYDLATDSKLDETTVIFKTKSLPIKKFWLKLDDYGEKYVGTFLFPEDY